MPPISPSVILSFNTNGNTGVNGNYTFPADGYFILMKQKGGTATVGGVSMNVLDSYGTTEGFSTTLFGLYVTAGTKNITLSVSCFSVHGILFAGAKNGAPLQIVKNTVDKNPVITPQKGHLITQFVHVTENYGSTFTSGYTPPTGFTVLTNSASLGSGGDWWHGSGSSYKLNTGTSSLTLTYSFKFDDVRTSYNIELEEYPITGGTQTIWII